MGNIIMAIEAAKPFVHAYFDHSGIHARIVLGATILYRRNVCKRTLVQIYVGCGEQVIQCKREFHCQACEKHVTKQWDGHGQAGVSAKVGAEVDTGRFSEMRAGRYVGTRQNPNTHSNRYRFS